MADDKLAHIQINRYPPDPIIRALTIMLKFRIVFIALIWLLPASVPALAQISFATGQNDEMPPARFDLVASYTATGGYDNIPLGLRVRLDEGWKIYWRSPGDAGLPPELRLGPDMASSYQLEMAFPAPERFSLFGLDTFGYADEVIFPLTLTGHQPGAALQLDIMLEALVCSDICIPLTDSLSLFLPSGSAEPSFEAQDIARSISSVPRLGGFSHLSLTSVALDVQAQQPGLLVSVLAPSDRIDDILVETDLSGVSFGAPERRAAGRYWLPLRGEGGNQLAERPVTLTLISGALAAEFQNLTMDDSGGASGGASGSTSGKTQALSVSGQTTGDRYLLASALFAAFLGGLILNIMPCVLPVLVLKVNSVLSAGAGGLSFARLRLAAGAGGIISSFLLLAAGLASLKWSGGQLGWGIQFQNLWFLSVMAVVMTLFSLSLFDRFQFSLSLSGSGGQQKTNPLWSDFISGFLATALATPCSAPFVGTAVSFAFAASPAILFMVLAMMGIGLAFPWVILAAFPKAVHMLPRPGAWMGRVKIAMGMGLVATIIWLLWLVYLLAGLSVLSVLVVGLCMMTATALSSQARAVIIMTACLAVILPPLMPDRMPRISSPSAREAVDGASYQPFSEARLAAALETGRPVFIDVTAAWCITCQVNKKLVLDTDEVASAFAEKNVILLRADWTEPNTEIAALLARYGRFAIPFNLLIKNNGMPAEPFPELISTDIIMTALDSLKDPA